MKIAIICNKVGNVAKYRMELIDEIIKRNNEVICIVPKPDHVKEIEKHGAKCIVIPNNRLSINIFKDMKYLKKLTNVLKEEKLDATFSFTTKSVVMGSIAAKKAKVPCNISMMAGMGYMYSSNKPKALLVRFLLNIGFKIAFGYNDKIIVQNKEDKEEIIKRGFAKKEKVYVVDGSGVNLQRFTKKPVNLKEFTFLMIARMLDVKGGIEYSKAAEIVKQKYPRVKFIYVGSEDYSYRGVKRKQIQYFNEHKIVEYMGYQKDVRPYLEESTVFVLPSYLKEGIPRTNLEALATGRPIITTNVRGCRETVIEGKNGFLVEPKNYNELAEKMIYCIENKEKLQEMGDISYKYAVERFDVNKINKEILDIIGEI